MPGGWVKQGLMLAAPLELDWSTSHVALPCVELTGELPAMYFATRDTAGRSWIARATLDLSGERPRVARIDPEPILAPGPLGAFDDSGVTPSCVVADGADTLLYYTGWSLGVTVPFYLAIGLAVSRDGGPFRRVSQAPILGRTSIDPYLTASPHVINAGDRWRMWYVSGVRWGEVDGEARHYYHVRYGESPDGVNWLTEGRVCLDFADEREFAFSRPCVMRDGDGYQMWYSVRGTAYRLGYAHSRDGVSWQRSADAAGLEPSPAGWDAEMIAYPHVFDHGGRRVMLYNGNGYGASGIGSALWEPAR